MATEDILMKKTNKEIIKALTEYFMLQPQEHTCKMLACMMIDLNRIVHYEQLGEDELTSLQLRVDWNIKQLNKFIQDGPDGELRMENLDS